MQQFNQNYFQLFGLPESYELDLDALAKSYREQQSAVHPDKFVNAGEPEKMRAVQLTSLVNEAYDTLKQPLRRAGYLLSLNGFDVEQVTQADLGMDLLMEQMQLREALEELPTDESSLPQLDELKREVQDKLQLREQYFSDSVSGRDFREGKKTYHEMQFLHKLLLEIDAAEEKRLDY